MVRSIGYNAKKSILEVEFNSNAIWQYDEVSETTYQELKSASSIGRFLRDNIIGYYSEALVKRKKERFHLY